MSGNHRPLSLDPQLVWKGKDGRDHAGLPTSALPLHVQERLVPQDLIDDLCRDGHGTDGKSVLRSLSKNDDAAAKKVGYYRHADGWVNRMILGDSLLVMNSLAEREGLHGQVQTVYFDPPYGIKFGYNWQASTRKRDEQNTHLPEQVRAYRDNWGLGIHSYLSHLRDRLVVARELLAETGSMFVQIGDENVHRVRCLLDEVFGGDNFIATIAFKKKKMPLGETYIFTTCDYVLWYGKDSRRTKFHKLFLPRDDNDYAYLELPDGRTLSRAKGLTGGPLPAGARLFQSMDLRSSGRTESCVFTFELAGRRFFPSEGRSWKTNRDGMNKLRLAGRLFSPGDTLRYKLFFNDYPVQELSHIWMDTQGATGKAYVVQTPTKVVERCLLMTTDPGDLVLDPTGGSGTTAYVAEQWGRRWITIDTSRLALALARTRLMTAKFAYYLLADSAAGRKRQADPTGRVVPGESIGGDLRKGFVYTRVPHVTLRSITNNPDIREDMSRVQMDAAIARHAGHEFLYDRPYQDRSVVRLCGPFTVASLSPHRAPSPGRKCLSGAAGDFVMMILDNLRTAGVQNTLKQQRLTFDQLDPFPGAWIHAEGEYTAAGQSRRVAIAIGPEHATIGPKFIRHAVQEAVRGAGFDLLVVCGFGFDAHAGEEAGRRGKLTVLIARMNPELAMGNELTGAGNLFMVCGEPEIEIHKRKDGQIVVEIKGVDVYDPTTGQVHRQTTDDIACWFIDSDYSEESFVVRHAYFCGSGQPYEKLQRALRATIHEGAWSRLYSTRSRPFAPPKTGKIAVKVINHYGDEVLKVFAVS